MKLGTLWVTHRSQKKSKIKIRTSSCNSWFWLSFNLYCMTKSEFWFPMIHDPFENQLLHHNVPQESITQILVLLFWPYFNSNEYQKNRLGPNFLCVYLIISRNASLEPIFNGHSLLFILASYLLPKSTVLPYMLQTVRVTQLLARAWRRIGPSNGIIPPCTMFECACSMEVFNVKPRYIKAIMLSLPRTNITVWMPATIQIYLKFLWLRIRNSE